MMRLTVDRMPQMLHNRNLMLLLKVFLPYLLHKRCPESPSSKQVAHPEISQKMMKMNVKLK
uniref:Uncharacterized protein n=1 Tax=Rhizophora mucronata TaxID=61149 RepID=A0A2P2IHR4_RHIMU